MDAKVEDELTAVKRRQRKRTPWRRIYSCIEPASLLYPGYRVHPEWDATFSKIQRDIPTGSVGNLSLTRTPNGNGNPNSRMQATKNASVANHGFDFRTLQNGKSVNTGYLQRIRQSDSLMPKGDTTLATRKKTNNSDVGRRRRHTVSRIELSSVITPIVETKKEGFMQVTKDAGVKSEVDKNQRHMRVPLNDDVNSTGGDNCYDNGSKIVDVMKNNNCDFTTAIGDTQATMPQPSAGSCRDANQCRTFKSESNAVDIQSIVNELVDKTVCKLSLEKPPRVARYRKSPTLGIYGELCTRRESEPNVRLSQADKLRLYQNGCKKHDAISENPVEDGGLKKFYKLASLTLEKSSSSQPKIADFAALLQAKGIWLSDPRLKETLRVIKKETKKEHTELTEDVFKRICSPASQLVRRLLLSQLTIPGFQVFRKGMAKIYQSIVTELMTMDPAIKHSGYDSSSNYIDFMQSRRSDKAKSVSMSVCTVDGQRLSYGDQATLHSLDSCAAVLNYCIACRKNGIQAMKSRIGKSALLRNEDEFTFDEDDKVLNPFTKAGSILTSATLLHKEFTEMQVDEVHEIYSQAIANEPLCCDNLSYNLKRLYAHEEISLAYFLSARLKLPRMCVPGDLLEFHFQSSSTAVTCDSASIAAATIANGGQCPLTDETVFKEEIIQHTLKRMRCHLSKSNDCKEMEDICYTTSESGTVFLVIPGVLGLVLFLHSYPRPTVLKVVDSLIHNLGAEFNFSLYRNLKSREDRCCKR